MSSRAEKSNEAHIGHIHYSWKRTTFASSIVLPFTHTQIHIEAPSGSSVSASRSFARTRAERANNMSAAGGKGASETTWNTPRNTCATAAFLFSSPDLQTVIRRWFLPIPRRSVGPGGPRVGLCWTITNKFHIKVIPAALPKRPLYEDEWQAIWSGCTQNGQNYSNPCRGDHQHVDKAEEMCRQPTTEL